MNSEYPNPTVLVTDGENRSSLAVTRSLGRYGCRVVVTGQIKKNLSSSSRHCFSSYETPSPVKDSVGYLATVQEILSENKIDVIFPMTESSVLLLAQNRGRIPEHTNLACPALEKIHTVFDKFAVFRLAQQNGVAIPQTLFVENQQNFTTKKIFVNKFPVVVKPGMSEIPTKNGFLATSVKYAANVADLEALYESEPALDFPSMIQERIVGSGTGLFTLFDRDRHLALFSHRRLREKPPSGGVSVVCESVPLDEEMVESSRKLLAVVGWQGVAMVEFKRDQRDGQAKLMEINGRFWGSLQLAIASGVDFPVLLLRYMQEKNTIKPGRTYRVGLKMKWFLGTLDYLLIRLRNKDTALNLPPSSKSKLNAFYEFCKIKGENTAFDVFDPTDSGPFRCEVKQYLAELFS